MNTTLLYYSVMLFCFSFLLLALYAFDFYLIKVAATYEGYLASPLMISLRDILGTIKGLLLLPLL